MHVRPPASGWRPAPPQRASGSALRLCSLLPQRLAHIEHDRISSQPIRISLAELMDFVLPDIGSHDEQLGMHPNIVGEASSRILCSLNSKAYLSRLPSKRGRFLAVLMISARAASISIARREVLPKSLITSPGLDNIRIFLAQLNDVAQLLRRTSLQIFRHRQTWELAPVSIICQKS